MVGGSVTTMEGRHFDPVELLDTVERHRINSVSIVGDAFAKPILRALDAEPDRWDISSLRVMFSSGVIWSKETKDGAAAPQSATHHGRRARIERGDRHGHQHHHRRQRRRHGEVRARSERPCRHRGRARRRRRLGRARVGSRCGVTRRSATTRTPRRRRPRSRCSTACATRSPATGRRSSPTDRSSCSAVAVSASTPEARRSTPKRWRSVSSSTRPCTTQPSSACPTIASARRSSPSSRPSPASTSTPTSSSSTSRTTWPGTRHRSR